MKAFMEQILKLNISQLDTKLGPMLAIADEYELYFLEFVDRRGLEPKIERLRSKTNSPIIPGETPTITLIRAELEAYFSGDLQEFKTKLHLLGSQFQKSVWSALMDIPYGKTRSYAEQAAAIGNKAAYRAVANANGANQLAIIIPCHRIINSNGNLGGYSGGVARKKFLIEHERSIKLHNKAIYAKI